MIVNYCPCCQDKLLCHISNNHLYWFCPTCWQAMPVSTLLNSDSFTDTILRKTAKIPQKLEQKSVVCHKSPKNTSEIALMEV